MHAWLYTTLEVYDKYHFFFDILLDHEKYDRIRVLEERNRPEPMVMDLLEGVLPVPIT